MADIVLFICLERAFSCHLVHPEFVEVMLAYSVEEVQMTEAHHKQHRRGRQTHSAGILSHRSVRSVQRENNTEKREVGV